MISKAQNPNIKLNNNTVLQKRNSSETTIGKCAFYTTQIQPAQTPAINLLSPEVSKFVWYGLSCSKGSLQANEKQNHRLILYFCTLLYKLNTDNIKEISLKCI